MTLGNRKDYALVPGSMTMPVRDVYGTLRIDCMSLMSASSHDDKVGVMSEGGEVVGYETLAGACTAQMLRYVAGFNRNRHNYMISLWPQREAPGDLLEGVNMRDVVEPPWLDYRTTLCNGKRCQVFLVVVQSGRSLAIEASGLIWRRLRGGV